MKTTGTRNRWLAVSASLGFMLAVGLTPQAAAQTPAGSVLVFRNVRTSAGAPVEKTDVMVRDGQLVRVTAESPAPKGAPMIDGGGNILSLNADGTVSIARAEDSGEKTNAGNAAGETVKIQSASFSTPERSARPRNDVSKYDPKPVKPQAAQKEEPSLASKVTDPSAPLSTILFQNKYIPSHWGVDADANEFQVQIAIPWKAGGKPNIFRATVPFNTMTSAAAKGGMGDVAILNITILPQKWGNFLIGPLVSFGSNKGPGIDTFAMGPSIGAVLKHKKWTYGFLNQNLFSFGGDIKISQLQPILAYTVNKKVSLALGDWQNTIDWNKKRFVAVPLSFQVNYIGGIGKQPIRYFINPQYNVINESGQRKWSIAAGFALILVGK